MTMLLAFVLFGAVLSSVLGVAPLLPAVGLALLAVLVVRPLAVMVVLLGRSTRLSWRGRAFIGWFGPRGLTSLLFALLVVEAGVPGYQLLLALTGVVVVASVLLHGVTSSPVTELYARAVTRRTLDEERVAATSELFRSAPAEVPRITVEQLAAELESPQPPLVLDVRSRSQHARDPSRIPGSIRVLPDEVTEWARARQPGRVVLYCT
jgi:NhaP-type Na+/H+ or K+/H+ antiporter